MGRSVSWETKQKLFSYEISLRNPWERRLQEQIVEANTACLFLKKRRKLLAVC
jgi:hypothetical protein